MTAIEQTRTANTVNRVVIVGGVAGGASAAARARRLSETAEIVLVERGPDVSFANCGMPYHIGQTIADRSRLLVQTPDSLRNRFGLSIFTRTEAVRIDRAKKQLLVRDLATGQSRTEPYDVLILSPGAEPIRPPLPGVESNRIFTLRSLHDMDAIKRVVDTAKPQHALIIGGGYIGLEMAEALRHRNIATTLVEMAPQVMNVIDPEMATPLHAELTHHGVQLKLNNSVTSFEPDGTSLIAHLKNGEKLKADLVIMAIGVRPETTLAKDAGLAIGARGGILVDPQMRTNDPAIYAVGDAVEVTDFVGQFSTVIPLAGPANRQGRIAADNAFGRSSSYKNTQGTAICKLFNLAVGMTGLSEKSLQCLGKSYEKIYVHPASHASYYPGAQPMTLKLLFDPKTAKVLGAQAVGSDGIDKRIDVLAVAIRAGLTVFDLEDLELSYAPPYGSAKDPVNYAGFVAANILRGDVKVCHVNEIQNPRENQIVLDVRNPAELVAGSIPNALNIPLDDLRNRLSELPREKEILVICQAGLRGYLACRILSQHGFACRNLSGGYKIYAMTLAAQNPTPSTPPQSSKPTPASSCTQYPEKKDMKMNITEIDATGLACPGPIMRLKQAIDSIPPGDALRITVTDSGFVQDIRAWCDTTGHQLLSLNSQNGNCEALIQKSTGTLTAPSQPTPNTPQGKTIVVFSGDLDKALAAFIIANGAAAMGHPVTLFFTFWGLNILRKSQNIPVPKTLIERMFGWMMPRGPKALKLSKMHMAGMGTAMIRQIMSQHHVPSLPELIQNAQKANVKLVACTMTMDLMGFKPQELIDGVEFGGVAMYLNQADHSNVNLFI